MTEQQLKRLIGLFIVISHFSVVIFVIGLYFARAFLFEEMTTIVALILPMFSVYTTAIIKYVIATKTMQRRGAKLNSEYIFITFLIPALFVASLFGIIFAKSLNYGFSSFDQFKNLLGLIQVIFGAYMGLILSTMFPVESANGAPGAKEGS